MDGRHSPVMDAALCLLDVLALWRIALVSISRRYGILSVHRSAFFAP